jgi:MFS family permease
MKLYPSFRGWWIVGVSFLGLYIHGGATTYLFSILILPMEADLGWSRTVLIGALTVGMFVTAATATVIGPLFDRHGARAAMAISALIGGASWVLLAFVTEVWQYYLLLGVVAGVTRVGLEHLGPRTAIANWFIRRRAAAFAWSTGGRAAFGATAVAPMAFLVAHTSWRYGWAILGVIEMVVLVPLVWIVIRRRPEDHAQWPDGDTPRPAIEEARNELLVDETGDSEQHWTRVEALHTRTFWFIMIALALTGLPATGMVANMLPYFQDKGLSLVTGSWAFSLFALGALSGRPVWGFVASRFGIHAAFTAYGISYGVAIGLFTLASNAPTLFAVAFLMGVPTGGIGQLQSQVWPDYFGRLHIGAITGATILVVTPAYAMGPLIAAVAFDLLGSYQLVFAAYSLGALVAGVFLYHARKPVRPARAG